MERFFGAVAAPPVLRVNDSSLVGPHTCPYCSESFAQLGRFQILVPNDAQTALVARGDFCTPECAAAANMRRSRDAGTDACANRHALLERRHGRRIVAAPGAARGTRAAWLRVCREQLDEEEARMAERELYVEKIDLRRATEYIKG